MRHAAQLKIPSSGLLSASASSDSGRARLITFASPFRCATNNAVISGRGARVCVLANARASLVSSASDNRQDHEANYKGSGSRYPFNPAAGRSPFCRMSLCLHARVGHWTDIRASRRLGLPFALGALLWVNYINVVLEADCSVGAFEFTCATDGALGRNYLVSHTVHFLENDAERPLPFKARARGCACTSRLLFHLASCRRPTRVGSDTLSSMCVTRKMASSEQVPLSCTHHTAG